MNLARRAILVLALIAGIAPAFAQAPPPVPALPDTERRTTYSISGTTCACNVNFALYGDSTDYSNWVEVFINGVRANYNDAAFGWTITSPTGSIATIPRPITDAVLTFTNVQTGTIQIVGARRPRRTSQFSENRGVAARDLNQALTDIIAQNRENWDKTNDVTGRAILGLPGETLALLPAAATRKNLGACFDNNGNLTTCVSVPTTTITAGNGITLSGTNPTTITNNIQAGNCITVTGTNPLTIANPCIGSITSAAVSGASTAFTSGQCGTNVSRSNTGAVMTDTLPGTGTAVLPANCVVTITNNDTTALEAISAAAGATIKGKLTANGFLYLGPGQTMQVQSDGSNYWPISVPDRAKLAANTILFIATSGNDSTAHGLTAGSSFLTATHAWAFAQGVLDLNGFQLVLQVADGSYTTAMRLQGPLVGQTGAFAQAGTYPAILQGNLVTPDNVNVTTTGNTFGAIQIIDGANVLVQGFKVVATGAGNGIYVEHATMAYKTMDFGAASLNQINAGRGSYVQMVGAYTISAGAGCHAMENNSWFSWESTATVTITGTPAFGSGFACGQYPGIMVQDVTPTFTGSATGLKCFAFNNGVVNQSSTYPGTSTGTSTGGQCN